MNPHYAQVAERAGHRCEYCHAPEAVFNFPFEIEHVIPTRHGGPDEASNWALSCRACNLFKGNRIETGDPQTGVSERFFDPRRQHWDEHFTVATDGVIQGLTKTGRATVEGLQMNRPFQLVARRQWTRLRLFPS